MLEWLYILRCMLATHIEVYVGVAIPIEVVVEVVTLFEAYVGITMYESECWSGHVLR